MIILLGILKLVAAAVTAFFGGYGLLHDFRRNGAVTREGKIALYGGLIAGLLTVTGQIFETIKQRADDRAAAAKSAQQAELSNQLMTQILRGVYPLKDITFDVDFDFNPNAPDTIEDAAAYKKRMERAMAAILRTGRFTKTEIAITDSSSNQPVGLILKDGSPLLPKDTPSEELTWIALNRFSYGFAFYSGVQDEKDIGTRNPNLSFSVVPDRREFGVGMSDMLQIQTRHAAVTSFYHDDSTIGGLKDLSNVIGTVMLYSQTPTSDMDTASKGSNLLIRSSSLRSITMHVGAKNCVINGYEFKKRTAPAPEWWFRFGPDTLKNCSIR